MKERNEVEGSEERKKGIKLFDVNAEISVA